MKKPAINVQSGAAERRRRRAAAALGAAGSRLLVAQEKKGRLAVTFKDIPRQTWEKVFGSEDDRQARFRAGLKDQKTKQDMALSPVSAPAIFGENKGAGRRMFGGTHRGVWDEGLGIKVYGRNHRNKLMKAAGLREAR